jgi:hypothetical protein
MCSLIAGSFRVRSDDIVTHDVFLSQKIVTDPSYLIESVIIDGILSSMNEVSDVKEQARAVPTRNDAGNAPERR